MKNPKPSELLITGFGVTSAIGQGKEALMTEPAVHLQEVEPGIVQVTMQDRVHKNTGSGSNQEDVMVEELALSLQSG
jgi:hypothetical protein